ncbi:RSM25 37S ribosomal protein S25 [Candida maltosa Xu316]
MKIQTEATNVLHRASAYLKSGLLKNKPLWYDIVAKYPPKHNLTRIPHMHRQQNPDDKRATASPKTTSTTSKKHFKTRESTIDMKSRNNDIHRIPKLKFIEDKLRNVFYEQHPWELARPKNLIENSGDDISKCDWSHMLQLNKPLDGESVVQRTLWFLTNSKNNNHNNEAYDKARFEYYRLRMSEEMESHVAREESTMYGGIFVNTNIKWNLGKEQEYIDDWTVIAQERTQVMEANMNRSAAPAGSLVEEEQTKTTIFEDFLADVPKEQQPQEEGAEKESA